MTIALAGLTTSGKSTVAAMMEEIACARRVARRTTRRLRRDDAPDLVLPVRELPRKVGDFVFGLRGEALYSIAARDVEQIKAAGEACIAELATLATTQRIIARHPPGIAVLVTRPLSLAALVAIHRERGTAEAELSMRLATLADDAAAQELSAGEADWILCNDAGLDDLRRQVDELLSAFAVRRRGRPSS